MFWNSLKRLVREDDGMEMVEWSIVGVVFALAAAVLWSTLGDNIQIALDSIGECVASGEGCGEGAAAP